MTPAQNKKYWRRWAAVARAHHWRMIAGRLDPEAVREGSDLHAAVWQAACTLAAQHARAVTPDTLRHACHLVALGRDRSHRNFSNREFDALLNLWGDERGITGLLLDPLNLAAEIHRAAPHLKTRERQLHFLKHDCLGGYVVHESERIFGTKNWESLPDDQLTRLHDHLRARPNALRETVECPF